MLSWMVLACTGWGGAPATPVTPAEATEVAEAFSAALAPTCHESRLGSLLDVESIADAGFSAMEQYRANRTQVVDGLRTSLARGLCESVGKGAHVRVKHTRMIEGEPRPLLRVLNAHGFDFFELSVHRRAGRLLVRDSYRLSSGGQITEMLSGFVGEIDLSTWSLEEANQLRDGMRAANARHAARDAEGALAALDGLPDAAQSLQMVRRKRLQVHAMHPENPAYLPIIEAYQRDFPRDPALPVYAMDALMLQGQSERAIPMVDQLLERFGEDAFLHATAGRLLLDAGQLDEAGRRFDQARILEPTLEDGHWGMVQLSALRQDHAATAQHLQRARDQAAADVDRAALEVDPTLASFLESAEAARFFAPAPTEP